MSKKRKRAQGERSHIEMNVASPIVWPREAFDELEDQLRQGLIDQLEATPFMVLFRRMEEALGRLFVGIRVLEPGTPAIVKTQEVDLALWVVDTLEGQVIRRRKIDIDPITVRWPV